MMEKLNELKQEKDSMFDHDVSKESSPLVVRPSLIWKTTRQPERIVNNRSIKKLCDMYPNDADLGRELRILIKNIENDR